MKTERNIITMDEYGQIHFPNATGNNIWMSTNELMELFGIIYPTLKANIKAESLMNARCKETSTYPMV